MYVECAFDGLCSGLVSDDAVRIVDCLDMQSLRLSPAVILGFLKTL